MTLKIALVGLGEIARAQHIPAITQSQDWELAATVSRSSRVDGIENFSTIEELLNARPDIGAVSLCMPPAPRFDIARTAINHGRHVMLEKPPGATVSECQILENMAAAAKVSLFATWHSREAAKLDQSQAWLADKQINSFSITWKEDVRHWHPGQEWIWQPGGMGVFDPGINALSILTKILPEAVRITDATLHSPSNRQTPIAASLKLKCSSGARGSAEFDWRQQDGDIWEILIDTCSGKLHLSEGGASLSINGKRQSAAAKNQSLTGEYPRLYQKMLTLITEARSDCDFTPLKLVADAFMLGEHKHVDAFEF